VPTLGALPPGCAFQPRCADRLDRCGARPPGATDLGGSRSVRCFLSGDA